MFLVLLELFPHILNSYQYLVLFLNRLLVEMEHLSIIVTHPRVQTLLDISVDVHSSIIGQEISELIEDLRTSKEDHHILHSSQRSSWGTKSVEEEGTLSKGVLLCANSIKGEVILIPSRSFLPAICLGTVYLGS